MQTADCSAAGTAKTSTATAWHEKDLREREPLRMPAAERDSGGFVSVVVTDFHFLF